MALVSASSSEIAGPAVLKVPGLLVVKGVLGDALASVLGPETGYPNGRK